MYLETLINLPDGTNITRHKGRFDEWLIRVNGHPPMDVNYFTELFTLSGYFGRGKVYQDFVLLYNNVGKIIDNNVINNIIPAIVSSYNCDINCENNLYRLFSTLYAVMISEENRPPHFPLKKRVKKLAVYQIFWLNYNVLDACTYSNQYNRKTILRDYHYLICKKRCERTNMQQCANENKNTATLLSDLCQYYGF